MHIEIQVALNFVISYLYNKLPRRRVNIFGEELEKALRDKFQGHWYPDKPFKGSAFRCLKTGDPIDSVFERAARESSVPITDILENLPAELSVWVDPGEVSYRIGEKGIVKIIYSENNETHEDSSSADCEVKKTLNLGAQCFRPIDTVNSTMNVLSLSPKTSSYAGSSPASSTSPTYKGSPNIATAAGSFMQRSNAPLTFTTASFAQTKFGSTKLKTSSKRASSSYRMSPTEFSNYIKQRAMQQQIHHSHSSAGLQINHFGPIGPASPSRSLSPNPLNLSLGQNTDRFYFPSFSGAIYPSQFKGQQNVFDTNFHTETNSLFANIAATETGTGAGADIPNNFNAFLERNDFYELNSSHQHQPMHTNQQRQVNTCVSNSAGQPTNYNFGSSSGSNDGGASVGIAVAVNATNSDLDNSLPVNTAGKVASAIATATSNQDSNNSKLMSGLNFFYSSATESYQHLLVAN